MQHKIELVPATIDYYPLIQNMARFYVYDMARYCGHLKGWECPANGLYECDDFKKYFDDSDSNIFLIKIADEIAGFAIVNKLKIMPEINHNMGEFYIVSKFQSKGIGEQVAQMIFKKFPGSWSIGAIPENTKAVKFWRKVVDKVSNGKYSEVFKTAEELKTTEHPDPWPMIMFIFDVDADSRVVITNQDEIFNKIKVNEINTELVLQLIHTQFPEFKNLAIKPVAIGGWDNRTFHLGDKMLVRLPSAERYALKVDLEHLWLPKLATSLPLPIPTPVKLGKPGCGYPYKWSIYNWIEGETLAAVGINDWDEFAKDLAKFLLALHKTDTEGGPLAGAHNFYRGGSLSVYDQETRQAINILKDKIDAAFATKLWEEALATEWAKPPVWIHGDISAGNLLVQEDKLCAVIDFGGIGVGDPACDLAIAWTRFSAQTREVFRATLNLDHGTWIRGRAWALWKALIVAAGLTGTNAIERAQCWNTLKEIFIENRND